MTGLYWHGRWNCGSQNMCQFAVNPYRQTDPRWGRQVSAAFENADSLGVHRSLDEYQPTPLVSLPSLASRLGLKQILVKDEAHRLGLKAFKALGASYAIYRFIRRHYEAGGGSPPSAEVFYRPTDRVPAGMFTFCTATDGNHGRGVAWIARKLKQSAVIYMPSNTVTARIESIRAEGARVVVIDGDYDDAVSMSVRDAHEHSWQIISDTSWSGYEEIPRWVMAGYTTMFKEIHESPATMVDADIVFVQAGVGDLAAAAASE